MLSQLQMPPSALRQALLSGIACNKLVFSQAHHGPQPAPWLPRQCCSRFHGGACALRSKRAGTRDQLHRYAPLVGSRHKTPGERLQHKHTCEVGLSAEGGSRRLSTNLRGADHSASLPSRRLVACCAAGW